MSMKIEIYENSNGFWNIDVNGVDIIKDMPTDEVQNITIKEIDRFATMEGVY